MATTDVDDFAGKVAIVTGASRGIGRATALCLAARGASLVLTSTREETLESVAQRIRGDGGAVVCVATPNGEAQRIVDAALEAFGRIDVLINNAGTARSAPFLTLTDEDWANGFGIKLFAAMRLCRAAWPSLKAKSGSSPEHGRRLWPIARHLLNPRLLGQRGGDGVQQGFGADRHGGRRAGQRAQPWTDTRRTGIATAWQRPPSAGSSRRSRLRRGSSSSTVFHGWARPRSWRR